MEVFDLEGMEKLPSSLREAALLFARDVRNAGGTAYIVGGAVRDLMLDRCDIKDVDIEVFGLPADRIERIAGRHWGFDECGASFGVLKLKGVDIDISLPRTESKTAIGHKGFAIESNPFLSIREAASRRDFTVNAMYFDPLEAKMEDPFGGAGDLNAHILRHVSEKFSEDPLRVLRGMQFAARFRLCAAAETIDVCRKMTIENLPPERLFSEWTKLIIKGEEISRGLEFLKDSGWLGYFPELKALCECRQDPRWHPEGTVWEHTKLSMDYFAQNRIGDDSEDLIVGLAVLCHDFGKPATTRWDSERGRLRSLGHDVAGVAPTVSFLRRLTNEERILSEVPPLVENHMKPYAMWKAKSGDAAVRRLALKTGRIDRLVRVCRADDMGRVLEPSETSPRGIELSWLLEAAERLKVKDTAPKPILMGRHLIELGFKPSKEFSDILKTVFNAQLNGEFSNLDGAKKFLREHVLSGRR